MLIVSRGYYSLTYLFSYLLISRRYRVQTEQPWQRSALPGCFLVVCLMS